MEDMELWQKEMHLLKKKSVWHAVPVRMYVPGKR